MTEAGSFYFCQKFNVILLKAYFFFKNSIGTIFDSERNFVYHLNYQHILTFYLYARKVKEINYMTLGTMDRVKIQLRIEISIAIVGELIGNITGRSKGIVEQSVVC